MITRPFNFAAHVTRPPAGFDLIAFIDICALLLFFALFGSRFVLAPGTAVNLPAMAGAGQDAVPTSRVLTVGEVDGGEMLIFEGSILDLRKFDRLLADRKGEFAGEVLLVRMDRDVSMDLFVRVVEAAKLAGFAQVLLAAEPEPATAPVGGGR